MMHQISKLISMSYIDLEHQQVLKTFQYKGTCASISYKYLWSPFAEFLLKFIPGNIAPNTITLVAFAIIVISHFVFMFYGDSTFERAPEPWKYALYGISLFVYQHLDNLDGKQARKTKNSSPVGMLFDHGCDAITSMLVGLQFVRLIQCQSIQASVYAITIIILIPNFIVIWTQYGTGAFHFDEINPIDEGLPCYQLLGLGGYFISYSFWKQHHWISSYNYEFLGLFFVLVLVICGKMVFGVVRESKREKKDLYSTLWLPFVLFAVLGAIKVSGLGELLYSEHFYPFFYMLTFFWGRNEIYMQICSVANQKYNALNWSTITFAVSLAVPILVPSVRQHLCLYLSICLVIQAIFLIELIVSFLKQASSILNIKLFSINQIPEPKSQ